MTRSRMKTKRNASKQERFDDMIDKLRKKAETKRKRLIKRRETALRKAISSKEKQEEEEEIAEEEKIIARYKKEMEASDEQAKIFFPDNNQWLNHIKKTKEDCEKFAQSIRNKRKSCNASSSQESYDERSQKDTDKHSQNAKDNGRNFVTYNSESGHKNSYHALADTEDSEHESDEDSQSQDKATTVEEEEAKKKRRDSE